MQVACMGSQVRLPSLQIDVKLPGPERYRHHVVRLHRPTPRCGSWRKRPGTGRAGWSR